jgi:hypothetical protein
MAAERPRYGPVVSTLGAIVLAVSVFLPWYGVSFTASGIALVQQVGDQVASQFGNASLRGYMNAAHANLSSLAGHQFTALSAHQALKDLNVVLLIVSGLAIAIALRALAAPASGFDGHRSPLALLGVAAAACVFYRMAVPPAPAGGVLALSLREGAWLSLLGSAAITGGALWPRRIEAPRASQGNVERAWSGLSGWTPDG